MSNGALSIPITADASKFLKTLATVKDEIKVLKKELDTATGARIAEIRFEITGLERMKKAYGEFGNYAEGTYGRLLQQLDYLNAYKLTLKVDSQEFVDTVEKLKVVNNLIDTANGKKIKIKTEVEPPPTGSIKAIQADIKKYTSLRDIEVDTSSIEAFNVLIQRLEDRLQNLKNLGIEIPAPDINEEPLENSIEGIRRKIRSLEKQKANIDISDKGSIAKLNAQIDELNAKINAADKVGFDSRGKITENAGKARQALTSLSLVAQDLPFGFIAIQNNLPALLDTFAVLSAKSGGVKGSLVALRAAILGPTGVFLAFSAITAAATYAIQKYGSFGNAIDALFGKLDPLYQVINRTNEAVKKFNKESMTTGEVVARASGSAEAQVIKMKALADAVLDTTESEKVRKYALQEMKSIDEARFGRYDVEKGKLDGLTNAVDAYTRSVVANSVAQKLSDTAAEALITRNVVLNTYNEQEKALEKVKKKYPDVIAATNRYITAQERMNKQGQGMAFAEPGVKEFLATRADLELTRIELVKLNDAYRANKRDARAATDEAIKFGAALIDLKDDKGGKGRTIDFKFDLKLSDDYKELINFNSLDKSLDRLKQYADVVLDINKAEKDRVAALEKLKTESKDVLGASSSLFDQFKIGVTPLSDLANGVDAYGFALQELIVQQNKALKSAPDMNNYYQSLYKEIAKGLTGANIPDFVDTSGFEERFNAIKELAKDLPKGILESFEEFKGTFPTIEQFKDKLNELLQLEFLKTGKIDIAAFTDIINAELENLKAQVNTEIALNVDFDALAQGTALIEKQVEKIKNNLISAFSGLQNILQDTFFKTLDEGKANWKEFADAVIKEVKRIAAALLAKAIVTGLANLLSAGIGSAVSSALGKVDSASLGGWLDAMDDMGIPDKTSAANFGGIRGADMAMSGSVSMMIRGNDLVGVMNRSNISINRVG